MLLTCPRGHQWEGRNNGPSATANLCPHCGGSGSPLALTLDPDAATLEPTEQLPPPPAEHPRVAGYEVRGVLGRGGMGVVYQAWHMRLKRLVALKMLPADLAASAEQRQRFRGEAE